MPLWGRNQRAIPGAALSLSRGVDDKFSCALELDDVEA
jgi:hypothetical protein